MSLKLRNAELAPAPSDPELCAASQGQRDAVVDWSRGATIVTFTLPLIIYCTNC
jgi:hypothetical protein